MAVNPQLFPNGMPVPFVNEMLVLAEVDKIPGCWVSGADWFLILGAQVTGKWQAKQHKIAALVNQVKSLQGKFTRCNPRLVPQNHIKFAFKLARDAIVSQSQTNQPAQSTTCKNVNET